MVAAPPQAAQDVLIFRVGTNVCAIVASSVAELILMPALMQPPGQPAILDGFLNLRGRAVPVVSAHQLFHLTLAEPDLHTPLIAIYTAAGPLALRVDSVEEVTAVDYDALLPYFPIGFAERMRRGAVSLERARGRASVSRASAAHEGARVRRRPASSGRAAAGESQGPVRMTPAAILSDSHFPGLKRYVLSTTGLYYSDKNEDLAARLARRMGP